MKVTTGALEIPEKILFYVLSQSDYNFSGHVCCTFQIQSMLFLVWMLLRGTDRSFFPGFISTEEISFIKLKGEQEKLLQTYERPLVHMEVFFKKLRGLLKILNGLWLASLSGRRMWPVLNHKSPAFIGSVIKDIACA